MQQAFVSWLIESHCRMKVRRHRQLVVLRGDDEWLVNLINQANQVLDAEYTSAGAAFSSLIYSDLCALEASITSKNFRAQLGSECQSLVIANDIFDVEAFAALSGSLTAGGVLFLCFNLSREGCNSNFQQRFERLLEQYACQQRELGITLLEQGDFQLPVFSQESISLKLPPKTELRYQCLTEEQELAVDAVLKVVDGHRDRPLVLTADRGRGKSSALALACVQLLLRSEPIQVVITAPQVASLAIFFKQLKISLPEGVKNNNKFYYQCSEIEFVAVDRLVESLPKVHLLLIDEAAAIPVYLLKQLLIHYRRLAFATTLHGYEGAGRGFELKFVRLLQEYKKQWQSVHIHQAIRWAEHDPLEQFVFDACLLDAKLPALPDSLLVDEQRELLFKVFSGQDLVGNESLLRSVFAILVTAHYQTSPSDLKLMLDGSQVKVAVVFADQQEQVVVAVALLMQEGRSTQLLAADVAGVVAGKRALKDQFLPQSLVKHSGFNCAFDFSYLRIMRIAVHPELQTRGLGHYLLTELEDFAKLNNIDFLGTSFGLTEQLLNFWQQSAYQIARIGFTRDQASGEYSVMLLKSVAQTERVEGFYQQIVEQFYQSFLYLLMANYQYLSAEVVFKIIHAWPDNLLPELSLEEQQAVEDFAEQRRQYMSCAYVLHLWLIRQIKAENKSKPSQELLILINRLLLQKTIKQTCLQFNLTGKKLLNQLIVDYVKGALE